MFHYITPFFCQLQVLCSIGKRKEYEKNRSNLLQNIILEGLNVLLNLIYPYRGSRSVSVYGVRRKQW